MEKSTDRRTFLGQAAMASLAAAGGLAGVLGAGGAAAAEPVQRRHGAKYKFTLAAYSYRSLLTGEKPQCTLEDFVDDCARFGLEGTEPTSYYFP
ncbi:MAG: sugar phosphate isomerase/epimerase, partial [Planctomycetes bacterium]|nr:sugar phosphate isomerase/epimerase [Planctomycetota bacterium]